MSEVDNLSMTLVGKDGDVVLFDSFAVVVAAIRNLLNELDSKHALRWRIKTTSKNSPLLMELETPITNKNDRRVVDDCLQFMREVPANASRNAANQVQTIVNVVSQDSVSHIAFDSRGRDSVIVWPRKKKPHAAAAPITPHSEYASHVQLTGTLEIASTEHGERAFYVIDRIHKTKVRCEVSQEVFNQALDAMKRHTSPRVAVYGKAQYRNDRAYSMKAEVLETLPTLEEHPGLYAVQGIDITGGMDCDCLHSFDKKDMLKEHNKHQLPGKLLLRIEEPSYAPPKPVKPPSNQGSLGFEIERKVESSRSQFPAGPSIDADCQPLAAPIKSDPPGPAKPSGEPPTTA